MTSLWADPVSEVTSLSVFKSVDLAKLSKGEPEVKSAYPSIKFIRGIEVESLFILRAPVKNAHERYRHWNGASHPELKLFQHIELPPNPSVTDFKEIASVPENPSVQALIEATSSLDPKKPSLQMSAVEAAQPKPASADEVKIFWANLLNQRANRLVNGGLKNQLEIVAEGKKIQLADEAQSLLNERPVIRDGFSAIVNTMLSQKSNPELYYELFDVEGRAAASLGATYAKATTNGWQDVAVQFYASSGYNLMLTLTQMWPVQVDGNEMTLVWSAHFVSSNEMEKLHGIERNAATTMMRNEVQKMTKFMMGDLSANIP